MKKVVSLTGATALLLAVLAVVALLPGGQAAAKPLADLEGVQWSLVSYLDPIGNQARVLPNTRVTAEFQEGRVSGSSGCNTYSAPYQAKDGKLTIGMAISTMMMCSPQAVMDQESAYLKALAAAAAYKIDGQQLTISDAKGATLLVFQAEEPGVLTGGAWIMTMYNNGKGGFQSGMADVRVTAVFDEHGMVAGYGGCNNYFATYTAGGNKITIGPVGSTRKACAQPIMDQETAYFRALESAATYKIDGDRLTMRTAEDAAAVEFRREGGASAAPTAAAPQAAATPAAPSKAKLENVYVGLRPAADAAVQSLALNLQPDGAAKFTRDFGKETPIVETGTWVDNAGGTLTVTLTDKDGKKQDAPSVMKFQRDGTFLTLVDYDKAVWGESGLKLNLAADVARKVRSPMVSIDLAAGFPLDPMFVSVNGGGEVDARLLSGKCSGYINRQPVVTVNWSGEADMARIFFYSDGDPTLTVLTPKGELLCNDNANAQLLDPFVELAKPVAGQYRIWVGSAAKNQLIPGILVLTTKPGVDLGTFEVGKLIKRPLIPQTIPPTAPVTLTAKVQALADKLVKDEPTLKPGADVTVNVTAEGFVPLFKIPAAANQGCAGLVTGAPSYAFNWSGAAKNLHVAFEGDADSTLMVVSPGNKLVICNDDAQKGNVNPAIDIPEPAEGTYLVYVGRISPEKAVKGTLTVTEAPAR
jgi:heat shock protein HslJ